MSSEKTTELDLHKWAATDYVQRTEFNDNFAKIDEHAAGVTTQLAQKTNRNGRKANALASIVFDDGYIWDLTVVHPYFASKKIKAAFALISGYIGQEPARFMSMTHINQLKAYGHEFLGHTHSHRRLTGLTYEEQYSELVGSKTNLSNHGLEINGVVYPENYYNEDTLEIVRKNYEYGFAMDITHGKRNINYPPVDQFALYRVTLENAHSEVKLIIDKAIAKNGYIVLMGHSNRYDPNRTDIDPVQMWQNARTNIEYLIAQGVPIVTPKEAMEMFGNTSQVGDDLLSGGKFAISKTGIAGGDGLLKTQLIDSSGVITNATNAYEFADNAYTIVSVIAADNAGFPTYAGHLHVYNFGERLDFVTQMWHPYNSNDLYIRRWLWNVKTWTEWTKVSDGLMSLGVSDTTITGTSAPSAFKNNRLSVNTYLNADNGQSLGFPTNAGFLFTRRFGADSLTQQEWIPYASNDRYTRYWQQSSTSWSTWAKVGWTVVRLNTSVPVLPASNGYTHTFNVSGIKAGAVVHVSIRDNTFDDILYTCRCVTDDVLTIHFRNFRAAAVPATLVPLTIAYCNS